ncbi:MAG: hypothetical protein HRT35_20730 [Algicola sp.]|nr:hypothetical protein [Algicola sp.]
MKKSVAVLLLLIPCVVSAGSLYTTPYKSANHPDSSKIKSHRGKLNSKITGLKQHISQINQAADQLYTAHLPDANATTKKSKQDSMALAHHVLKQLGSDKTPPLDVQNAKSRLAALLGHKTVALQAAVNDKTAAEKGCPVTEFCKLVFSQEDSGFGDMQMNPFDKGTDYKINALNYSVYLGEEMTLPFQVYLAEVPKTGDKKNSNTKSMLDPTQGLAVQVPWLYRWGGNSKGGFCNFQIKDGHCIAGGDVTFRYVELRESDGATDKTKGVMGFSAGFGSSIMLPFFQSDVTDEAGHISLTANLRTNYHNHDQPNKLFDSVTEKKKFNKWFSVLSIAGEIAINDAFTVKFEYFKPLSNKAHMDEVFKVSFTMNKF